MEIVFRSEAKSLKLKYYFTGKPCKKGHVNRRYTNSGSCMRCIANDSAKRMQRKRDNMNNEERQKLSKTTEKCRKNRIKNMTCKEKEEYLQLQRKSRRKWWENLTEKGREQEKTRVRAANRKIREEKSPEELWLKEAFYDARRRAKKKNLEFSIEKTDLIMPEHCPVFGIPIYCNRKNGSSYQTNNSPSVDRIDNNKGYTKDNIAVISWRANSIKGNATLEELKMLVKWLEEQQS